MLKDQTDVCVVGGGPAGMALALLPTSGVQVTVVERSSSLKRVYRGEVLRPGGISALDQLGALDGAAERGVRALQRSRLVE